MPWSEESAIYKPNMTNLRVAHIMYFNYDSSQSGSKAFYSNIIEIGIDMLPKRSTDVDQHFKSDQEMSQLSLAIFIVSGTHRRPQKSFIL